MTKLEMMHMLQAQVSGCISAYPELPHQRKKQETADALKSKLKQETTDALKSKLKREFEI